MALAVCFLVIHALCTADMPTPVHCQDSGVRSTHYTASTGLFNLKKKTEVQIPVHFGKYVELSAYPVTWALFSLSHFIAHSMSC